MAIKYLFISGFGSPPKESWKDMKLVSVIAHLLQIPKNSYTSVMNTLESIDEQSENYDGSRRAGRSKVASIQHRMEQADIVYRAIGSDLSAKNVTHILNMYRQKFARSIGLY